MEKTFNHILPRHQIGLHIPLPAAESVGGTSHLMSVDSYVAESVNILQAQIHRRVGL